MLRRSVDSFPAPRFSRLALAALALVVASCEDRSAPTRVLIVGDSISLSSPRSISGDEPGLAYAEKLSRHLGQNFEVTNVSCGGSSSIDWSVTTPSRFCPFAELPNDRVPKGLLEDRALPELPAETAIVLFGTNDAVGFGEPRIEPVEPDAYGAAIDELVTALLSGGVQTVILMAPPKFNSKGIPNPNFEPPNVLLAQYREKVRARCNVEDGVVCGPDLYELLDIATDFAPGDVHPNANGHEKIEAALYPFVIAVP